MGICKKFNDCEVVRKIMEDNERLIKTEFLDSMCKICEDFEEINPEDYPTNICFKG